MKQNEILFLLGSVVLVVFSWIAFTIIHNSLTSTITGQVSQSILSIPPTFDTKVIDKMRAKTVVLPAFVIAPPSQTEIVVSRAPTPPPVATSSGQTASSGGQLQ